MVCGLTARTRTSLAATTSRLSAVAGQPVCSWNRARAAGTGSLARQVAGVTSPAASHPRARAAAICPAPRKPTRSGGFVEGLTRGPPRGKD